MVDIPKARNALQQIQTSLNQANAALEGDTRPPPPPTGRPYEVLERREEWEFGFLWKPDRDGQGDEAVILLPAGIDDNKRQIEVYYANRVELPPYHRRTNGNRHTYYMAEAGAEYTGQIEVVDWANDGFGLMWRFTDGRKRHDGTAECYLVKPKGATSPPPADGTPFRHLAWEPSGKVWIQAGLNYRRVVIQTVRKGQGIPRVTTLVHIELEKNSISGTGPEKAVFSDGSTLAALAKSKSGSEAIIIGAAVGDQFMTALVPDPRKAEWIDFEDGTHALSNRTYQGKPVFNGQTIPDPNPPGGLDGFSMPGFFDDTGSWTNYGIRGLWNGALRGSKNATSLSVMQTLKEDELGIDPPTVENWGNAGKAARVRQIEAFTDKWTEGVPGIIVDYEDLVARYWDWFCPAIRRVCDAKGKIAIACPKAGLGDDVLPHLRRSSPFKTPKEQVSHLLKYFDSTVNWIYGWREGNLYEQHNDVLHQAGWPRDIPIGNMGDCQSRFMTQAETMRLIDQRISDRDHPFWVFYSHKAASQTVRAHWLKKIKAEITA